MTRTDGTLRFGVAEWIGIITLCLSPAAGFSLWGLAIDRRVTSNTSSIGHIKESHDRDMEDIQRSRDRIYKAVEPVAGIHERLKSIEAKLEQK